MPTKSCVGFVKGMEFSKFINYAGNVARGAAQVVSAIAHAACPTTLNGSSDFTRGGVRWMGTAEGGTAASPTHPAPLPFEASARLHKEAASRMAEPVYRAVPSTRTTRAMAFGSLFFQLGWDRLVGSRGESQFIPAYSHRRIVETLCRMRGAVMKLGQMLSIQDDSTIPAQITELFERVRDSAYAMPASQLNQTLAKEYGNDRWREELFVSFVDKPVAAASIGQVHIATIKVPVSDVIGKEAEAAGDTVRTETVAVKVQYPGVARSIDSDVANLRMLMSLNILPPGLFVGNILDELRRELSSECSYEQEAEKQMRYGALVEKDADLRDVFVVPRVYRSLSTDRVLVTQMVSGVTVDKLAAVEEAQDIKNYVAKNMLQLTLTELFRWRFMQTDPNYSNFLFCPDTNKISLIDFGAAREYSEEFVRDYLEVVAAAARKDRKGVIDISIKLGFLTGNEMREMLDAHAESVVLLGLPFANREAPFDFSAEQLPSRIQGFVPTIVKLRLRPPPTPVYSLHRRLSGAILLSTKLKAVVPCGRLFWEMYDDLTK
ncbi:putative ABC1 protein [Trypanosoma vivax]|uniref:Putative ABC1 protein n=1 Tax=Trypanosoma vivax (strain Y486) TaxID=1055687 RepID=G0U7S3_TRYVY|nr:putative ABC1 protein [Trypanosoma vivax]CCC51931.1 putative ABC1 protein [Trypanosoma vivax Y486]